MSVEVWIQGKLFPEFPPDFYAYEMESIVGTYWEVFDDSDGYIGYYEPDEFPDFLDFCRQINYDVKINNQESWIAMEDSYA